MNTNSIPNMLGTQPIYQHSNTGNYNNLYMIHEYSKQQLQRLDGNQRHQNIFKRSYIKNHLQQFCLLSNNKSITHNHPNKYNYYFVDISLENLLSHNNKYKFNGNVGIRLSRKLQIKFCDFGLAEHNIMNVTETRCKYKYKQLLLEHILNSDEPECHSNVKATKLSTNKRSSIITSYCGSAQFYNNFEAIHFGLLSPISDIYVVRSFAVKSGKFSVEHQTLCFDQSYYDEAINLNVDALQLVNEINNNLQWKLTPQNMYNFIGKKQKNKCSIFMTKHNLELNQCEFIAIKLWSLSEQLTKHYHIDCENNKLFKWKLFINALTNGIRKIHKAVIINTSYDIENKVFPSLPESLYRGTKVFNPNCKTWRLETILSFTTSLCIAAAFGQSSQYNEQNEICVLNIDNAKQYLLNGQLIAAPIGWLSIYSSENEWIVLPSISTFYVKKDTEKRIIAGNMYKLLLTNNVQ